MDETDLSTAILSVLCTNIEIAQSKEWTPQQIRQALHQKNVKCKKQDIHKELLKLVDDGYAKKRVEGKQSFYWYTNAKLVSKRTYDI